MKLSQALLTLAFSTAANAKANPNPIVTAEDVFQFPQQIEVRTSNGRIVENNQDSLTCGPRGPVLLQDFALIDKLSHFDRERIPERVVHAKGAGAHGVFTVTSDKIRQYTKAHFLGQNGRQTPVFCRFSTVGGERGSADTARDPRGFACKFYTEEGNWDMVGNNTPVFFIRDPSKFPDFIHTQKRDPQTNLKNPNMIWDFWSLVPESLHQVTILFSDKGTPDGYRHMDGFSSHTFTLVDAKGNVSFVKWHFRTNQGIQNLLPEEAERLAGEDPDYATRDLFDAIERQEFPSWTVSIQRMEPEQALNFKFDIFDVTKSWPEDLVPLEEVGVMELNRNPDNYFAEVEQAAFAPAHLVPGLDVSNDKMLQGRLFAYPDTQRHRLGVNHQQIPINQPLRFPVINQQRDGFMTINGNGGRAPNYEPNSFQEGDIVRDPENINRPNLSDQVGRFTPNFDPEIDFVQAGDLFRSFSDAQKERIINNVAQSLSGANENIRNRQLGHFERADPDFGAGIAARIGEILSEAPKPAPVVVDDNGAIVDRGDGGNSEQPPVEEERPVDEGENPVEDGGEDQEEVEEGQEEVDREDETGEEEPVNEDENSTGGSDRSPPYPRRR